MGKKEQQHKVEVKKVEHVRDDVYFVAFDFNGEPLTDFFSLSGVENALKTTTKAGARIILNEVKKAINAEISKKHLKFNKEEKADEFKVDNQSREAKT
ncbi:MAG: hypothetical protein GXO75_15420 [Calditrichaeota bacterium]|nr:hypothetical protein [Calditrichota bacterium]